MDKEKIQLSFDEIQHSKNYYTQLEKWTLDDEGKSYIYMGLYISVDSIEALKKNKQDDIADVLLATYTIPITCREENNRKTLHIERQDTQNKIAQYLIGTRQQMKKNLIQDYESPQIHIDTIYVHLDSIKELFQDRSSDSICFRKIYLNFVAELDALVTEDMTISIIEHQEADTEDIHPIQAQMIEVRKLFQKFLDNFGKEKNIEIATHMQCTFFDALPSIRNYFYAFYFPPKPSTLPVKQTPVTTKSYTEVLENLQEKIRGINRIFPDVPEDGTHPLTEKLFRNLFKYIKTIAVKPQEGQEMKEVFTHINDIFAGFVLKSYEPDTMKKAASYSISLSKSFMEIKRSILELLAIKKYVDKASYTVSARDIYKKITQYHTTQDYENLVQTIEKLQEFDDKEIFSLLSSNDLQKLLEILVDEEKYKFASRIRDCKERKENI